MNAKFTGVAAALGLVTLAYVAPAQAEGTVVICQAALSAPPAAVVCAGVGVLLHEFIISDKPFGPNGELMKIAVAPVKIVSGNIAGTALESGELAKALRGITGVSVHDIERHGIFGGPNSIFRKPFG